MRALLFALAVVLGFAPEAIAAEVTHTLREGETLQQVARYYYGAAWKASYIVGRNGLTAEADAKPGKAYVVPAGTTYKIRKGDSLASIAKRELGDKERYRFIMTANGITDINDLEVGRELHMPFVIKHTVAANESLASIAKLYFRSTKQAKLIQEYNALPTATVALGAKLLVPVVDKDTLDVKKKSPMPKGAAVTAPADEAPPPEEPKAKDPPLAAMPSDEPSDKSPGARIRRAIKQYHAGDFDEACRDLERLLGEPRLARDDRLRVIEYCGYCAVAFGDMGPARDYFRRWLEMRPDVQLDPVFTSPKIRTAVEEARKDIQRSQAASHEPVATGDGD